MLTRKYCLVCAAALPAFSHESVCDADACRQFKMQYQLRPPTTDVERKLYAFQLEKARINIAKKKAEQAEKERVLQAGLTRREHENRDFRQKLLTKRHDLAGYPWLTLPSGQKKIINLPMRRRRAFRDFLNKLIGQIHCNGKHETNTSTNYGAPTHIRKLQAQFCSVCQGGCCTNGSNNAYLTSATLLNYMRLNPQHRPRHVFEAYLERIPNKSFADSCIYHTHTGCNLPRQMRSDICNQFLCSPVTDFCNQAKEGPTVDRVLVLVRKQDLWRQTQLDLDNRLIGAYLVEQRKIKPLSSTECGCDVDKNRFYE